MEIVNAEGENLHFFWTVWRISMHFSGNVWLITLSFLWKVIFGRFWKNRKIGGVSNWTPPPFIFNSNLLIAFSMGSLPNSKLASNKTPISYLNGNTIFSDYVSKNLLVNESHIASKILRYASITQNKHQTFLVYRVISYY